MLVDDLRAAFGWDADIVVSAGPRGALERIWRLDVGPVRFALKEIFAGPPPAAVIEAEPAFARRAAEAGVWLPACHPDLDGSYLFATRDGRWLRLYGSTGSGPNARSTRHSPSCRPHGNWLPCWE